MSHRFHAPSLLRFPFFSPFNSSTKLYTPLLEYPPLEVILFGKGQKDGRLFEEGAIIQTEQLQFWPKNFQRVTSKLLKTVTPANMYINRWLYNLFISVLALGRRVTKIIYTMNGATWQSRETKLHSWQQLTMVCQVFCLNVMKNSNPVVKLYKTAKN